MSAQITEKYLSKLHEMYHSIQGTSEQEVTLKLQIEAQWKSFVEEHNIVVCHKGPFDSFDYAHRDYVDIKSPTPTVDFRDPYYPYLYKSGGIDRYGERARVRGVDSDRISDREGSELTKLEADFNGLKPALSKDMNSFKQELSKLKSPEQVENDNEEQSTLSKKN